MWSRFRVRDSASFRFDAEAFEAAIQGTAAEAERPGRFGHAAVSCHSFADEKGLDVLEAHVLEALHAVRAAAEAEIARRHGRPRGHQHTALDRVLELAHVSRPWVAHQGIHRRGIEARQGLPVAAGVLLQKMGCQQRNVVAAIAQRREDDLDRVQPKQQVLAKTACGDFGIDLRVGGRQDPDVDASRSRRSKTLELS